MVTAKPNRALGLGERIDGVWTSCDLREFVPHIPVSRQFPSKANLLDSVFTLTPKREFFRVKRDGVAPS